MKWPLLMIKIEELRRGEKSFGNGQDNPDGMRLKFEVTPEKAETILHVEAKFQGWPGVCHGGIVATALDEAMGHSVSGATGSYSMSAELEVFYLAPVPTMRDLKLTGRVESIDGRKVVTSGEIKQDDVILAHARGLYITVKGREEDLGEQA